MEKSINNETRLAKMEQKLDNIVDDVKEISKDLKDHIRWEGEKYEKLDSKYSGKWVEKLTLAIAGGFIIAVLTFLLK
jgi:Txe/YoeB family toxin of Txe-Axe toxin-antitoxin module